AQSQLARQPVAGHDHPSGRDVGHAAASASGAGRRPGDPAPARPMITSAPGELRALRSLARAMGVHTRYIDGLGRRVSVGPETLVRVCAALGAPVERVTDAAEALRLRKATRGPAALAPVLVAWDGVLPAVPHPHGAHQRGELRGDDSLVQLLDVSAGEMRL